METIGMILGGVNAAAYISFFALSVGLAIGALGFCIKMSINAGTNKISALLNS